MAQVSRYQNDDVLSAGRRLGTASAVKRIRDAIADGSVSITSVVLKDRERLDILAHKFYGDGRLWWILAAASNIGWGLQCPPGIRVVVPTDIAEVQRLL